MLVSLFSKNFDKSVFMNNTPNEEKFYAYVTVYSIIRTLIHFEIYMGIIL